MKSLSAQRGLASNAPPAALGKLTSSGTKRETSSSPKQLNVEFR